MKINTFLNCLNNSLNMLKTLLCFSISKIYAKINKHNCYSPQFCWPGFFIDFNIGHQCSRYIWLNFLFDWCKFSWVYVIFYNKSISFHSNFSLVTLQWGNCIKMMMIWNFLTFKNVSNNIIDIFRNYSLTSSCTAMFTWKSLC